MKVSFKSNVIENLSKPQQNNGLFPEINNTMVNKPIDKTPEKDTLEITKKHLSQKAKIAIGLGIAAAAIAVGAGIIYGIKTGKFLGARKAQKYAEKVQTQANKIKEEVTSLYNNGGKIDGKIVANIDREDGIDFMREMASDGTILRESMFIDKILSNVSISTKKGKDVFSFLANGKLSTYKKGWEWLADGSEKAAKKLFFEDGKLFEYTKGLEKLADGSEKAAKKLFFEDGKLFEYTKGFEKLTDGSVKVAKVLLFKDGKLSEYGKGLEKLADGSVKVAKGLLFKDGKLSEYGKGLEKLADGSEKAEKYITRNGSLIGFIKEILFTKK